MHFQGPVKRPFLKVMKLDIFPLTHSHQQNLGEISRKKSVNLKVICIGALLPISYRLWLFRGKSIIFVSLPWKSMKHSLPSDTER